MQQVCKCGNYDKEAYTSTCAGCNGPICDSCLFYDFYSDPHYTRDSRGHIMNKNSVVVFDDYGIGICYCMICYKNLFS